MNPTLLLARDTKCDAHNREGKIIVLFILMLIFVINEEGPKILE